jgi:hypothetical protein
MTTQTDYGPRTVRARSTKAQVAALDDALVDLILMAGPPVTVRQTYYMAAGRGLVSKDQGGYRQVIRRLTALRDRGTVPWEWIADNTRWVRKAATYRDLGDALAEWQAIYRRDYWQAQPKRVEVWVESDSIASFIGDTVDPYGVPLYVCRGQASRTYIRGAVNDAQVEGKPVQIIYVGDFDPSGLAIDRSLVDRYAEFGAGEVPLTLTRVAVTPEQIAAYDLFGYPAKRNDPNYRRFLETCAAHDLGPLAYETEALPPQVLRSIVDEAIAQAIDHSAWRAVASYETAERMQLDALINTKGDNS